jgi:hypothetical protein
MAEASSIVFVVKVTVPNSPVVSLGRTPPFGRIGRGGLSDRSTQFSTPGRPLVN